MSDSLSNTNHQAGAPDWKARAANHLLNIFNLAVQRKRTTGAGRITGDELYKSPEQFGRSPRNRISELAQMGCVFRDARLTAGKSLGHWEGREYVYILESWPETFTPLPVQKEIPWGKRGRVKTDFDGRPLQQLPDGGPLFGGNAA